MGSNVYPASSGITTSDLITQPQWVLLGSYANTSGATTMSVNSIPPTYRSLRVIGIGVGIPSGGTGTQIFVKVNANSGTTIYGATGLIWRSESATPYWTPNSNFSSGYQLMNTGYTVSAGNYIGFEMIIDNYSTTDKKPFRLESYYSSTAGGSNRAKDETRGIFHLSSAITSLDFGDYNGYTNNLNTFNTSTAGIYVFGAK